MPGTAGQIISNLVNRSKGLDEIHDDVQTIDTIVDVPAKDATADVQMSDVVGKKDDTAVAAVGTTKSLVAYVKGIMNDLSNATDGLGALKTAIDGAGGGETIKVTGVTAAANAGADTVLATVATAGVIIRGVVIHADAAQTADLTSCPVMGGAAKALTFVGATLATQANLDAENKQVAETMEVYLPIGATIVMVHNGTGATALDLTTSIRYVAAATGGTLS